MPPLDPFQQYNVQALYHFTDKENLAGIRAAGGLYSRVELQRRKIVVPKPGGNEWSQQADGWAGMDRYVHLCLSKEHPMPYLAKKDGRIGDVVFLEIDPSVRHLNGVMYSPGVSNKAGTMPTPIKDSLGAIDLQVLCSWMDWSDPAIYARRQAAEKCEVLVPNHVPAKYIRNL